MVQIGEITGFLDNLAPPSLQEEYDNAGLLTGNREDPVRGVLIALDSTEEVIDEAVALDCNLIIAHHPIIFRGLKKITGSNYVERSVIKAIRNNIAIYAVHTNLDNVKNGVNKKIAEKLGLTGIQVLKKKEKVLRKLVSFVPVNHVLNVLDAIHKVGAGVIGNYDHCSFRVQGTGRYRPNEEANPHIGSKNEMEEVKEERIELIYPHYLEGQVLLALKDAHPYEEVAYYIHDLQNFDDTVGSGMIGVLEKEISASEFLARIKEQFNLEHFKYAPVEGKKIRKVAVCGGAGSFLINVALKAEADAFVSADIKYHEYFDAEGKMLIADIGHYESEVFTKDLIFELLNEKFRNIAPQLSKVNTNPIRYI